MAFHSGFFDSKGLDRTYTAEDFTTYLSSIICNGILDTYGDNFNLTSTGEGRQVVIGTGKAWINGHYFVNDEPYLMDFVGWQDPTFPRYIAIVIACDTSDGVRNVWLDVVLGQPAENPQLPEIPTSETRTNLLLYAVRMNPGASCITEADWWDYRADENVCGYCKCILGKCRVTELLNKTEELIEKVNSFQARVDELTNDIIESGQCGDSINYIIYSDGTILLRGTGEMYDYGNENPSPFYDNENLKTLMVSDNITSIGNRAFYNCENLTSASLPTTLKTLGSGCFLYKYENLGEVNGLTSIAIPNGLTEIGDGAFWGSAVTSLTVPPSVETVGQSVCQGCTNLETVRYEGAVIGEFMFIHCTGLKNFTIATTVKELSMHCFRDCKALESITYEGSLEEWEKITKRQNWDGRTYMNVDSSGLERIQCTDGYMQFDSENKVWNEVRE